MKREIVFTEDSYNNPIVEIISDNDTVRWEEGDYTSFDTMYETHPLSFSITGYSKDYPNLGELQKMVEEWGFKIKYIEIKHTADRECAIEIHAILDSDKLNTFTVQEIDW
jgi:hypothetical protein